MPSRTRLAAALLSTLIAAVCLVVPPLDTSSRSTHAAPLPWVDASDADAVRALYDEVWRRSDPAIGWTGAVSSCDPGTTSAEVVEQSIERVNAYRSLAGVTAGVVADPALSEPAQAAAMLMLANNTLSHFPPPSWTCYSPAAADGAGHSNLYLGRAGVDAIDGYIIDPGANNAPVGHRWWILRPTTQRMGVGNTNGSNALWVTTTCCGSAATRDPDGYITWPNAGYVPTRLLSQRWSVMNSAVDLSEAQVSVTGPNGPVPTTVEYRATDRVVFIPVDPALTSARQLTAFGSTAFTVAVTTPETSYTYTVRPLDLEIGGLVPRTPHRIVDTRSDLGVTRLTPSGLTRIPVRALADLPQAATAIAANVTVVDPAASGFISVTNCTGPSTPAQVQTSTLNFARGENRANLTVLPLSADGSVCVVSSTAAELLIDLAGHYAGAGQKFTPVTPERIIDTRQTGAPIVGRGDPLVVQVTGRGGVPVGATSVTVSLTATGTTGVGYLTAWPCDAPRPEVSNVNFVADQSVPNLVTVRLDPNGQLCVYADATTHALVDVAGYTSDSGVLFSPLSPARIADTRQTGAPLQGRGTPLVVQVAGQGGVPFGATSVTMNLTATNTTGVGYLTAWPCDATQPEVSNVNFVGGQSVPNLATVRLDANGRLCVYADATTHVIVDVSGYTLAG